jgi:hypothetical protein
MIQQKFYTALFLMVFLTLAFVTEAQDTVRIKASVDKDRILIGEPIRLTLEADIPEHEAISFFVLDTLSHFEFLAKEKIDTVNTPGGTRLTQIIRITSFDSGSQVIPAMVIAGKYITDSIPIEVSYTPFDPNQQYHDIKDVIDVDVEQKKHWWKYAVGFAGIILLLLLIYQLNKKKKPVAVAAPVIIDPYKDAMEQIDKLESMKLPSKQHYTVLVDIFRNYVFRKKGINSLQKTADDLVIQLAALKLNKENFDKVAQALRLSDFVKFAKFSPLPEDDAMALTAIKTTIKEIEQMP